MNLTFKDVTLQLGGRTRTFDFTLSHTTTGLFGPSGSGKTSILELVAGLRKPASGQIAWDGVPLTDVSRRIFVPARYRTMGYIPQDLALFPHLTVRENIHYGRRTNPPAPHPKISAEKLERVLEIAPLLDRNPVSLSGGEKQRVAFARALLSSPRLLLFDEPLASLDQDLKDRILPYLERIREEFGLPMIYVTHSASEIMTLCADVLVLQTGAGVRQGPPGDVFESRPSLAYRLRAGEERGSGFRP